MAIHEKIVLGVPRMGAPIPIGGADSRHPASVYAVELEQIGYAALREAFPDKDDAEILHVYNPEDAAKVAARVSMISKMGNTGTCWAVPKVMDLVSTAKYTDAGGEEVSVINREEKIVGLMGFGLIRSNKSTNKLVNFTAEKLLRRPAVARTAELHVRPEYREQGIGSLILTRLAVIAAPLKLMSAPEIPVLQGYTSAEEFFHHYGFNPSKTTPLRNEPDYFGPGKAATIQTYDGLSWNEALVNIHERDKLPNLEKHIRAQIQRRTGAKSKA